jgi:energy-coupling factor transporter ATP-binding protein EcfA2
MIDIRELTFQYEQGDRDALQNVSLHIPPGGFLGIIGPSGAGKSTLLHAMSGVIPHHYKGSYYGSVKIGGRDTFEANLTELSLMIGTVFQDIDSQLIAASVEDELLYGLENFGFPHGEIERRIRTALDEIGIGELRHRRIHSLSGGQKQKVALAAVLALQPRILLLDEPTGELDPGSSRQIYSILRALSARQGITVVVAEQKIMLLSEFAKELAVMRRGEILFHGPVRAVLRHANELENLGVNCPRVVTLSHAMKEEGLSGGEVCIRVEEAEQMIRRALS